MAFLGQGVGEPAHARPARPGETGYSKYSEVSQSGPILSLSDKDTLACDLNY